MKLSVIIPAYKEAARIPSTAARLTAQLDAAFAEGEYEIIFVNDGSPDNTAAVMAETEGGSVRCVGYPDNRGKGAAVRFGMAAARGDIRIFTDCDLAYGTEAVTELYEALKESGADLMIASRAKHKKGYEGYSFFRRLLSRGYYFVLRIVTGLHVSDSQSGLKGFRAAAAERIFPLCTVDRFAFDLEVLLLADKMGFGTAEMPATVQDNAPTKIKLSDPFRMLADMYRIKKRVKKLDLSAAKPADTDSKNDTQKDSMDEKGEKEDN